MTSLDKPTPQNDAPATGEAPAPDGARDPQAADGAQGGASPADKAILEAFGGVRGMIDTTVPGLVFILLFTIKRDIHLSAIAALGLTLVLAVIRLIQRDTLKHAFSGVFGVAFGAVFAMMSGDAKNFYLPGMLYTLGLSVVYILSAVFRFPLIGVLLGPILRENLSWRTRNPGRFRAYTRSTWAWGLILLAKSAILFPIYWWGDVTQLGWLKVALGIPPFLLCVYLTWIFLAKAPPPIDVIAEMEAEEKAGEEAGKARRERESAAGDPFDRLAGEAADNMLQEFATPPADPAEAESAARRRHARDSPQR